MNNPRDLEIARLLGWYRIPLVSAPKVIAVDYLAFYQTSAFADARWQIKYIAPLLGHELATRAELLKDEPDHPRANQEYFKIQIGSLLQLPAPLPAGAWHRITFFYTTGEYLLGANTVQDLVVKSDERQLLWQALRERASQGQHYHEDKSLLQLDLEPELLAILLGIKELEASYHSRNLASNS